MQKSAVLDGMFINRQNLLYQKLQLLKEIQSLTGVKSLADNIDLISVEEFSQTDKYREIEDPEDLHSLQLARLDHELQERGRLVKEYDRMQSLKNEMKGNTDQLEKALQSIPDHLKNITAVGIYIFF